MFRYYRNRWILISIVVTMFIIFAHLHHYHLLHEYVKSWNLKVVHKTTEEPVHSVTKTTTEVHETHTESSTLSTTLATTPNINKQFDVNELRADDASTLVDLHNFEYILNSAKCESDPLLLIVVHSAAYHADRRLSIRTTWGQPNDLIRVVFLVAVPRTPDIQKKLKLESALYRDVVQGNFIDDYRNMTYKHTMALKWFIYHCPGAGYVLKLDDDTFFNTPYGLNYVRKLIDSSEDRLTCDVYRNYPVVRDKKLKWFVTYEEYPDKSNRYPTYCAGYAILYSPRTAFKLYKAIQGATYFWIDDAYVTGVIAARVNVTHRQFDKLPNEKWGNILTNLTLPEEPFLFGPLNVPAVNVEKLWNLVESANASRWNDTTRQ